MMTRPQEYRPAGWLTSLARLNPKTKWPWRHSTRLAVAVTLPMLIGLLVGHVETSMLVCLGALLNSVKVQSDPYRIRFLNFLIVVPMAMVGFLLGSLVAGHGLLTLVLLILVALASGLVSGYGAVFSTGAMQMLVLAVIAGAGHITAPIWQPPLLFASGAALAALLLGVEALFDRHLPERLALARLLRSLAHLARIAADPPVSTKPSLVSPFEQQRRHVTDAMSAAYSALLEARLHSEGGTSDSDRRAALLSTIGMIFSGLVAHSASPAELRVIGQDLDVMASAVSKGLPRPHLPADPSTAEGLVGSVRGLLDEIWPEPTRSKEPALSGARRGHAARPALKWNAHAITDNIGRLTPGHDVVVSAFRLALCLAIAFAAQIYLGGVRSYWIPLCVVIVLKPDFGSVFVRAMQRSIGTILGVAIGVLLLTLVPKGGWLLGCTAVLGFLLPAAGQRGYAMQCTVLTPLVLILIDMTAPGATVDFGPQRLVDTLIGSGIVLVFGYLIWPRDPAPHIHQSFSKAMAAAGKLLQTACVPGPQQTDVFVATLSAYRSLSNVRTTLQRAIAEPPPASREATAWYPILVEMERLCDCITRIAQLNVAGAATPDPAAVQRRLAILEALGNDGATDQERSIGAAVPETIDGDAAFGEFDRELARLTQLLKPVHAHSSEAHEGSREVRSHKRLEPPSVLINDKRLQDLA